MKHKWVAGDIGRNNFNNWFIVTEDGQYSYFIHNSHGKLTPDEVHTPDMSFVAYTSEDDTRVEFLFNIVNIAERAGPYGT